MKIAGYKRTTKAAAANENGSNEGHATKPHRAADTRSKMVFTWRKWAWRGNMSRKPVFAYVLVLMFLALNRLIAATAPTLVGSWEFTVMPTTNAHTAAVSIEGLATFTSDGTVVETD